MIKQVIEYKNILNKLGELIEKSPYKKSFIIKKTGISTPTFYRKLKSMSFTPDETLKIIRLVKPENDYLYEVKQSIKRGSEDYKTGHTYDRSEVLEEVKKII